MKNWIRCLTLFSALLASHTVMAMDKEAIASKFASLGLEVDSLKPAPVNGLLQAITDRGLFYISEDGNYLLHGRIFNLDEGMRNETEEALMSVRAEGIKAFEANMIEYPAKDEKYKVSIFTDITCGYCRRLHNQMLEYNDLGITVRYLAFPRQGVPSKNYDDMVSVWCADNPQRALTEAKNGGDVKNASCENQVAEEYAFGQKVGVNGTPAIVFEDGQMMPGYQPPEQLLKLLQQK